MSWTRGRIIGRGSAAAVSLATCCSSGTSFAVKSAELSRSESLRNEAGILSVLDSPHIVGYRGYDIAREGEGVFLFNLFLEYAPHGSLSDVIRKRGRLEEAAIVRYAQQMLAGLGYLHSRGISHRDVKPSNVLVGHGDCAKIADFGCARRVEEATATMAGTPMYMAPEVARGEEQGCAADVWAFGCTVVEMASGNFPWPGVCDPLSAIHKIVYSGETPEIPSLLSAQAKDFLEKCLRRNPKERWTASQLLDHPFLGQVSHGLVSKQAEEFPFSPTSVMDSKIWELAEVGADLTTWLSENGDTMDERIDRLSRGDELLRDWSGNEDDGGWMDVREEEGVDGATTIGDRVNPVGVGSQKKLLGTSCENWSPSGGFGDTRASKQLNS
ncbi:hypothetical protein MLD38_025799 [Melastoma candidum]|uniref:Uncharacterized protein n=1 Tax=Melastoma candidum TaxID=119954 RepID=A0ACB9NW87_9MYRT|nr:hypothetical protein MLD38_025799 [Melastoma candidum]